MNREELWRVYAKKNPSFAAEDATEIRMTARGLRKLFEQTYDIGFAQGKKVAGDVKSVFERVFGK